VPGFASTPCRIRIILLSARSMKLAALPNVAAASAPFTVTWPVRGEPVGELDLEVEAGARKNSARSIG
jgi:hypothetical protein